MWDEFFGSCERRFCAAVVSGKELMLLVSAFLRSAPEARLAQMDITDVVRSVLGYDDSDKHKHKCETCRTVWMHTSNFAGDWKAHCCPACGHGPFWDRWVADKPEYTGLTSLDL